MATTVAYSAGLKDGLAWDLDGYESWNEVEADETGWDEATIGAIGGDAFAEICGVQRVDDEAFGQACRDYNRGAHDGATRREGRTGLPPNPVIRG